METKGFSVRLDPKQSAKLRSLARQSGRNRSQVVQRLIDFASENPDAQQALGIWQIEFAEDPRSERAP